MPPPVQVGADTFSQRYTWGDLFVVVPRESPDAAAMQAALEDLRVFLKDRPGGCALLILVEAGSKMLDRTMREELAGTIREFEDRLLALDILIAATGFLHAAVPMIGMILRYSSRKYPRNLTRSSRETAEWLAPYLSSAQRRVDADELTDAIESMRRAAAG